MKTGMRIRVYLEDTDAGGIVYHTAYLRFMERARTDFIRHLGLDRNSLARDNILFVVRRMVVSYATPAYLDDELGVYAQLTQKRKCAVNFMQEIVKISDGSLVCQADVQVVCLDAVRKKPRPLPQRILSITET